MSLEKTDALFLENTYQCECDAMVLKIECQPDGSYMLLTDRTAFYPTGGGQPCDKGVMSRDVVVFTVSDVRHNATNRSLVEHIGSFAEGSEPFAVGSEVHQTIDKEYRLVLARLHSFGHLLDQAIYASGYNFPSTKGNHRVGESYVEYDGKVEPKERDALHQKVQVEADRLIEAAIPTEIKYRKASECSLVASFLHPDDAVRVVCVGGDCSYPCGGTHVGNTSELRGLHITKVNCRKGQLRLSYQID